jgi:threonine dehydratase
VPVTVVMPEGAVASKVAACREYGAEVVLWGAHVGESLVHLEELRVERGLTLVHPYDDPEVLIGNGSCGLEILDDLPDVDVVVVGVGGGGLMGGVTVALKESHPAVRVFGVEPVTSNALQKGLEAGEPVRITPVSVADGLGAPTAGRLALQIAQRYLDDVVLIDDPTILAGLRFSLERLKQVVEPAGAAALAAVLSGAVPLRNGDRVCVILSGGNVAVESLGGLLAAAGSLPSDR